MGYVPHYTTEESVIENGMRTIDVHPPNETKRPVGYAPWPKEPKKKRKRKKKR